MKTIDEFGKEITNPDLSLGYIMQTTRIKPDAIPVDGKTKLALAPDDYEEVQYYILWTEEELAEMARQKEEAIKKAEQEAFLEYAPQYIEDIMNAIAEIGVIVSNQ